MNEVAGALILVFVVVSSALLIIGVPLFFLFWLRGTGKLLRGRFLHSWRLRRTPAQDWAAAHEWRFTERDDDFAEAGADYPVSTRWHRCYSIVEGTYQGHRAASWIVEWDVGTEGLSRQRYAALWVSADFPRIGIKPSSAGDQAIQRRLDSLAGRRDDVIVGNRKFDSAWDVSSDDVEAARALLNPRITEMFLRPELLGRSSPADPDPVEITVELRGGRMRAHQTRRLDLEHLDDLFALLHELAETLPDYVFTGPRS